LPSDTQHEIEVLFQRYARGVGGYAVTVLGNAAEAEDVTARVFLTVVSKFAQCRREPAGWLWAIARNEIARHVRDRRANAELPDELADGADPPPLVAERNESTRWLAEALEELGEEQHKLIYMKFFQDMNNLQIAAATGLSAGNVGVRLHRAIKRLRARLGDLAPTPDGTERGPHARATE